MVRSPAMCLMGCGKEVRTRAKPRVLAEAIANVTYVGLPLV